MTLYETLNLDVTATEEEIRSAYSELLSKYSLDAARGNRELAEKKISDIKYAKKILLDPEERKNYDSALQRDLSLNNTENSVSVKVDLTKKASSTPENIPVREREVIPAPPVHPVPDIQKVQETKVSTPDVKGKISKAYLLSNFIAFGVIAAAAFCVAFIIPFN